MNRGHDNLHSALSAMYDLALAAEAVSGSTKLQSIDLMMMLVSIRAKLDVALAELDGLAVRAEQLRASHSERRHGTAAPELGETPAANMG